MEISIHALREEGDRDINGAKLPTLLFLSTPSARRATDLTEGVVHVLPYFYPRPPRGGRPIALTTLSSSTLFLSTPSARRATAGPARLIDLLGISIHALREEGDSRRCSFLAKVYCISIHALREEGDGGAPEKPHSSVISIHALREEGDPTVGYMAYFEYIFLSTPSARRATAGAMQMTAVNEFLSTPSARRATLF